ncbi:sigma-54-dependent transcriptional regulator [Verrucomicrobiota bacterium]
MDKPTLLIVDDEKHAREGLARGLRRQYQVLTADNGLVALEVLSSQPVDVMLSDIRMPGLDGVTMMQRALAVQPDLICLIMTAYGDVGTAVNAMRHGAVDFIPKPINLDQIEISLNRALSEQKIKAENRQLKQQLQHKFGLENIIGESAAMQEVFDTIRQVAPSRATVLIQGESGTGKELVAKALHQLSSRANGSFVPVHCAALSANLLESELFGHERGAFTGASEQRKGRFELADGGTLFMDEIGEIDMATQVKILRVLEERRFERVGGVQSIDVDTRLITATNRDLQVMVDEGTFREDLFYRLDVVLVRLPSLRERVSDIPLLLNHYLKIFAEENAKELGGFTPDAVEMLSAYRWPGNVRELRNVVENMVVMARNDRLGAREVPSKIKQQTGAKSGGIQLKGGGTLEEMEREMIRQALEAHEGNRTKAAEQLGISRRTLHRKLNEYGL